MDRPVINKAIIIIIVMLVSALFLAMIRQFIMVVLLAGIFSAMAQPVFRTLTGWCRGRKSLASLMTLLLIFLMIFLPLAGILGIVAGQAISISQSVKPWIEQWINTPSAFNEAFQRLPYHDLIYQYQSTILQKAAELVGSVSSFLFNNISSFTMATIYSIFLFFVFLYTMFFLIQEGDAILNRILYYLPLPETAEQRLLDRFTSVTRATIKGTLVIGIIQGSLAGLGFWVAGIDSALFWGTIMTLMSVIPSVGAAIIWFPAVIFLAATGHYAQAAGLFAYCALLVGTIDNLLRPWIVGRDTELHELMIFFGTLGGISMFGLIGFIVGPIIAALFVTIWQIYAENFSDYLSDTRSGGPSDEIP